MKICTKCNELKEAHEFRLSFNAGKYRAKAQCRACENTRVLSPEQRERKKQRDRERGKLISSRGKNRVSCLKWRTKKRVEKYSGEEHLIGGWVGKTCAFGIIKCTFCEKTKRFRSNSRKEWVCLPCSCKKNNIQNKSICPNCSREHMAKHRICKCVDCAHKAQRVYHRAYDSKRNMMKKGRPAESIWKNKVFALDGWRCHMCNKKVQKKNIYADNAAELDHIIPISKGGLHTYDNVQTLCRSCNQKKSDSIIPTQLRMVLIT